MNTYRVIDSAQSVELVEGDSICSVISSIGAGSSTLEIYDSNSNIVASFPSYISFTKIADNQNNGVIGDKFFKALEEYIIITNEIETNYSNIMTTHKHKVKIETIYDIIKLIKDNQE